MSAQKTFALVLGIVLVLVGIIGFINDPIFGYFDVTILHNLLHLIAGAFGIYVGTKGQGIGYNKTIGWIGIILGILGFIPGINTLLANPSFLAINMGDNILHLVIGIVAAIVAYTSKA